MAELVLAPGEELLVVDDGTLVVTGADDAGLVVGSDGEGHLPAVNGGDGALRPHLHPHGGGGVVGQVQGDAHTALTVLQIGLDGGPGGLLHQRRQEGGGENV